MLTRNPDETYNDYHARLTEHITQNPSQVAWDIIHYQEQAESAKVFVPLADPRFDVDWEGKPLPANWTDPKYWEAQGWQRNWGDAAVMSPYMEVLRKEESRLLLDPDSPDDPYKQQAASFLVICPSFLGNGTLVLGPHWGAW